VAKSFSMCATTFQIGRHKHLRIYDVVSKALHLLMMMYSTLSGLDKSYSPTSGTSDFHCRTSD